MSINPKKTLERLRGENDRKRISLYLSVSLFEEFRALCGDVAPSRIIEEMMRDFIATYDSGDEHLIDSVPIEIIADKASRKNASAPETVKKK